MVGQFSTQLEKLISVLYSCFESCKDFSLVDYPDELTFSDVASQFKRPEEFLQVLLDIVKVTFHPCRMGTLFLNSNPAFIIDSIPKEPFRLGYLSVLSEPGEAFADVWSGKVADSLRRNEYDLERASAVFLVVSTGEDRYRLELADEVCEVTNAGFSVEEVLELFASEINDQDEAPRKEFHSGYVFCEELFTRLRISLWIFLKDSSEQRLTVLRGGKSIS